MSKVYRIEDGLFNAKSVPELANSVISYLSVHGLKFEVKTLSDGITLSPEVGEEIDVMDDFSCALVMCNSRRSGKARKLLKSVIERRPLFADAYRNLAQVEMMEGNFDCAINLAQQCLELQPRNYYALILLGNLYARDKGNKIKGLEYYQQALEINSESSLALCNVAAIYREEGRNADAIELFKRAIKIDPTYLNPYLGLAGCYTEMNRIRDAFNALLDGLKNGKDRPENSPQLVDIMQRTMFQTAQVLYKNVKGLQPFVEKWRGELEQKCKLPVRIQQDEQVPFIARMEIANRRNRSYHQVSYNPEKSLCPYSKVDLLSHLVMHELGHLSLWMSADELGKSEIHYTDSQCAKRFFEKVGSELSSDTLQLLHGNKEALVEFLNQLLQGVCSQAMNCIEDMFVEEMLFRQFSELRPLQLLSMYRNELDGANSVREGEKRKMPRSIVRANKVMNMITAMNFERMWGFPTIGNYRASVDEQKQAREIYGEYLKVLSDYRSGDEYPLIREVVDSLRLRDYIIIESEADYFGREREKEERQEAFTANHKDGGSDEIKKKVACMMCIALKRLKQLPDEEVKQIAAEIALLGVNGISPDKDSGYKVASLPDLDMSGYECLSYYYVSWALAFPEKLSMLGLPFADAYRMALELYED